MPITPIFGSGGGNTLTVKNEFIFASSTIRDTYFTTNPLKLEEGLYVSTAGILEKYNATAAQFVSVTPIIPGPKGIDAAQMQLQYSTSGDGGWTPSLNTSIHKYWRWSTDGGTTWMPVYPAVARFTASADGGGIPDPFDYLVSPEGKLQLRKNGVVITENDEYGGWIKNSVFTGTGSLHLGELHAIGSAGENVIFKNEDSTLAWHPCWGAISADGTQVIEQSARVHSGNVQVVLPAGAVGTASTPYNTTFISPSDVVFLYIDLIPKETYTGKLTLVVTKTSDNKEISRFEYNAAYVSGVKSRVPFRYPLWTFAGQQFNTKIIKPNGDFLQVTSNQAADQPYRESYYRTFSDQAVFHAGNAALQATALNALTGVNRISASAIRDLPTMSNTVSGMAKLGVTMSVNGNGELNTTVSPTSIKIVTNQVARLALPQTSGTVLVIQQDSGITYGIEANQDPSVEINWKQIGIVATNVVSFNGRNGAVVPAKGDYTQKQIKTVHDVTLVEGFFGIDNQGIYWDDGV